MNKTIATKTNDLQTAKAFCRAIEGQTQNQSVSEDKGEIHIWIVPYPGQSDFVTTKCREFGLEPTSS